MDSEWQPIATAPKDGTLLLLLVDYSADSDDGPLEDDSPSRTVGFNNADNNGSDAWEMAGYCWTHDHFTSGHGWPIAWQPFPAPPPKGERQD